ncbi:hypothetical protein WR25_09879 [Diploscapter pachys]|uniref:DIX domain-containing protein n=1 Tax=Diploscapter pachys TaxID=2018661 RepID=A0A2A2LHC7_9BILA|nr:hypothetical protein WR25_09879 [Diploscapter pachys]
MTSSEDWGRKPPPGNNLWWPRRLEYVLNDRPALDAFRKWLERESQPEAIDLYYAIKAYTKLVEQGKREAVPLAETIYGKFLSSQSPNCCHFIPTKLRQEVGQIIRSFPQNLPLSGFPPSNLFHSIAQPIDAYLRSQHDAFTRSDEFIEAFNEYDENIYSMPGPSNTNTERRRSSSGFTKKASSLPPTGGMVLTQEALKKSQQDRQYMLGESTLERMYPTPMALRQPYVCHATTSQNDSAVSSSFSSDANSHSRSQRHHLRSIKEEHLRNNTHTYAIPRVEHAQKESKQYDHSTVEGRQNFADDLTKRLNKLIRKIMDNDRTQNYIRDIVDKQGNARDVIMTADAMEVTADDEDDVEKYLERMRETDSLKASAHRTPKYPAPISPGTFSPDLDLLANTIQNIVIDDMPSGFCNEMVQAQPQAVNLGSVVGGESTLKHNNFMSNSTGPTFSAMRYTNLNNFAPPPRPPRNGFNIHADRPSGSSMYSNSKCSSEKAYESSGIGSMAPSNYSFLTDGSASLPRSTQYPLPTTRRAASSSSSTPRRHRKNYSLTLQYKDSNGVPYVAHVEHPSGNLTLKEFRRHFSISSSMNPKFYFKSECEDGSAPYQLELICDDSAVLPVFQGKISAEVKYYSGS